MERKIPDFAGTWKMKNSENFEELLKALGVNVMLRKIAVAAASKPSVEITQEGETLSIRTFTSVRTTHVTFTVGESFNEATVDGRPCTSLPKWETDSKISCEQTLQKGEGPKTAWTREITNDGELILVRLSTGYLSCQSTTVRGIVLYNRLLIHFEHSMLEDLSHFSSTQIREDSPYPLPMCNTHLLEPTHCGARKFLRNRIVIPPLHSDQC
uniref:Cytosolic fatty-acid binding proteins domain-containing protein n=1 Tax=Oncorhynchus tshawytscha TaxID=74940 RepID=A0AAZ3RUZ9_ONCTS